MSTVTVFGIHTDLAASQTASGELTLTWSAADPLFDYENGDAEAAAMTGWSNTLGNTTVRGPGLPQLIANPKQGSYIFWGGAGNTRSLSVQRTSPLCMGLTIADITAGKDITVEYWPGSMDQSVSESVRVNLYFYDKDAVLISSDVPSYTNPGIAPAAPANSAKWAAELTRTVAIPSGTCFIDVEMDLKRNNGSSDDAVIDDLRITLEDAQPLPYVPGYAIYRDGVLIATAAANATEYIDSGLIPGDYDYQIRAYDGTNFLSDLSNTATGVVGIPGEAVTNALYSFDDEQMFTGYLGGRLRGNTVACPGDNANEAKPCC